jgi:hypothetical protein
MEHGVRLLSAVEGAETEGVRFHEATALTDEDIAAVQHEVRTRVLRLSRRRDLLLPDDAAAMRHWEHGGGFSLDAKVRIEARDRAGLERLLLLRPSDFRQRALGLGSDR